jgi:hypothetical protein
LQDPAERVAVVFDEVAGLDGVDPDAVAVGALVQDHVLPLAADQVVPAGGTLHEMGASLGGEPFARGGFALLAEEVGFAADEILVFVAVKTMAVCHAPAFLAVVPA